MKAVSLFSGGLDSQLAVCVMKDQAIEIIAVNFVTPFFGADPNNRLAARQLGIEYHEIDIGHSYMEILKNPVYGYGKNINPCIDCHAFMLKNAGEFMEQVGASFLITGEVLGERPMSQNKSALQSVEKLSGMRGLILRPLSALLLKPTIPETEGWVDRSRLLDISGRGRKRQMELAQHYGIIDYPTPAGGCLLTQENYAKRMRSLLNAKPDAGCADMNILRVGRHFYLEENLLLVVGRNQAENESIERIAAQEDYLIKVADRPGPLGLLRVLKPGANVDLELPASIVARYSDARDLPTARINIKKISSAEGTLVIKPMPPADVPVMI